MRSATDIVDVKVEFEAGLDDVRSAFNLARRHNTSSQPKRTKGSCRKWWQQREQAGHDDALVNWAWTRRNAAQHEGDPEYVEHFELNSWRGEDVVRPPGFENASHVLELDGWWLVKDSGTTRERRIRPTLTGPSAQSAERNVAYMGVPDAPSVHLNQPIPDEAAIDTLLDMVIEWTQGILDDSLRKWPTR